MEHTQHPRKSYSNFDQDVHDNSSKSSLKNLIGSFTRKKHGDDTAELREDSPLIDSLTAPVSPTSRTAFFLSLFTWSRLKTLVVLLLLLLCVFLFSSKEPHSEELNMFAISSSSPRIINLHEEGVSSPIQVIEISLAGQKLLPWTNPYVRINVSLEQFEPPQTWIIFESVVLELSNQTETQLFHDFVVNEHPNDIHNWRLTLTTNSVNPIAYTLQFQGISSAVKYQVLFAGLILIGVYVLIVFELIHRCLAAMLGAFVALAILSRLHVRPSLDVVISWIDFETCGLLFGMMIMVGIFSQTGFFEFIAVKAYKLSKGNVWRLVVILCLFSCFVSAFLDNVTTILLMAPVTIRLCNVLDIPPTTILISLVLFSNIGGTATPIGDPPNIIIVNAKQLSSVTQLDFLTFTVHVAPGVILSSIASFFVIKKLTKKTIHREPNMHKRHEVELWKKSLKKMHEDTPEERLVKQKLAEYVAVLENELSESKGELQNLIELEQKYIIKDWPLFVNSCAILGVVVLLFFLHSALPLELSLAWIAIIGAMAHLLISGIRDIEEVLEKVEFGTLLFFASLFVLMKGLEELGLIEWIGEQTVHAISQVPAGMGREIVAIVIILWVSAIASAFIDNIPYTAAMVPIIAKLGTSDLGLQIGPLIWALSLGTCFGGNGSLVGASANVVAAGISESQGYPISFNTFFKLGFPTMLVSVSVATVYMVVFHVFIPWY